MSDFSVNFEVVGTDRLIAKLDGTAARVRAQVVTAMNVIAYTLVNYVKDQKLSGQVLHRRTGTLSRSIKGILTDTPGRVMAEIRSRDKGNAPLAYAARQEYGFQGQESVRAHVRRTASGGFADVRAFVRNVNYPAHPFMKPTLDENKSFIEKTLRDAVVEANK